MTPHQQQNIEELGKLIKQQADETNRQIDNAMSQSSIDSDYDGEVRGLIRQFMALAQQQYEERQYVYHILSNPETLTPPPIPTV